MEFYDDIEFKKKQEQELRQEEEDAEMSAFRTALNERVVSKPAAKRVVPEKKLEQPPAKRKLGVSRFVVKPKKKACTENEVLGLALYTAPNPLFRTH